MLFDLPLEFLEEFHYHHIEEFRKQTSTILLLIKADDRGNIPEFFGNCILGKFRLEKQMTLYFVFLSKNLVHTNQ